MCSNERFNYEINCKVIQNNKQTNTFFRLNYVRLFHEIIFKMENILLVKTLNNFNYCQPNVTLTEQFIVIHRVNSESYYLHPDNQSLKTYCKV